MTGNITSFQLTENRPSYPANHNNYNFLDCDWFKKLQFFTISLAKLLLDSLLLDIPLTNRVRGPYRKLRPW